jgi:hypothetical protein
MKGLLKKALRLVAERRGETVANVGHEVGAEIVCGTLWFTDYF